MPLTDAKIRNTKPGPKPAKLADGGGLYLEVRPTGAKLWRYRYRIAGKENLFAIGEYPSIALAEARAEHGKARALVKQGVHPSHNRQAERLSNQAAVRTPSRLSRRSGSRKSLRGGPRTTRDK